MPDAPNTPASPKLKDQIEKQSFKIEKPEKLEKIEKHEHKEKPEKLEKPEKEIKEKPEKIEHKEKPEKHEHKEKPEKFEHKEKPEKHEHKELEKIQKDFDKINQKLENPEKQIFEGNPKDIVENQGPFNPSDPIDQRVGALEQSVASLQHFISTQQRPDLSRGALASEPGAKKSGG
ncbi:hypothetical protein [Methylocapsa palsarum]|uniref:Uncharacterized protein n=1 Tax=Methylocapsa palsarum TaxID=1612308 RepID=A0A1I3WCE0_9HYPH|nr:hypothetical protein [Methylocapsa palsarum]SFK05122.1 hypothetical protein SAMN05444581_101510 [Methylocapsa palsarum]